MKTRTLARGLTVVLTLALMLGVVAVPAAVAAPAGTAAITSSRTILAGTPDAPFSFTVTNTAPLVNQNNLSTNPSINWVEIIPPANRYTAISTVTAPTGWTGFVSPSGTFIFRTSTAAIPPGNGSAAFTVAATVSRPTVDNTRKWSVVLSSDDGVSGAKATAPANNTAALDTTIKVLQASGLRFTVPSGVVDGSSTSNQPVTAVFDMFNAGSGTLTVTPQITFSNITSGNPATAEASGSASCPAAQSVASLATVSFTCTVTLTNIHSAGRITVVGGGNGTHATDGSASALTSTFSASAMTAAVYNYIPTTLQPTDVSPGKPFTFRLSINKTGQVAVNLNAANTTLTFGPPPAETCNGAPCPTFRAELDKPASIAGGTQNNVLLEFKTTTVPAGLPAGQTSSQGYRQYTPTLTITATDENDFAANRSVNVDNVLVDALGPALTLTATPPQSEVPTDPRGDAATDDRPVTFSGTITDRGTACGTCVIRSAVVKQFNSAQAHIAGADIPVTITNSGGTLSGSFSGKFAREASGNPLAFYMALEVVGADVGGSTRTATSDILQVDNVLPLFANAETGGRNPDGSQINERAYIDVTISEMVRANAVSPTDFAVDGHRVVEANPRTPQTLTGFTTVRLIVEPKLGRNEETVVTWAPSEVTRPNDRVALRLPNASKLATDGILPAIPVINSIGSGATSARQEGQFFTNDDTPDISLTVDPGDTVSVYEDHPTLGTQGALDANDIPRCSKKANPPASGSDPDAQVTVTCTASSFSNTNRTVTLLARSIDTRGNVGVIKSETLSLDFLAPALQAASRLAGDIVVKMTEKLTKLLGRNAQKDWAARIRFGGEESFVRPTDVLGEDDQRTLLGDGEWNSPALIYRIEYVYLSGVGDGARYADRAGNDLPNQLFAVSLG